MTEGSVRPLTVASLKLSGRVQLFVSNQELVEDSGLQRGERAFKSGSGVSGDRQGAPDM